MCSNEITYSDFLLLEIEQAKVQSGAESEKWNITKKENRSML